MVDDPYAAFPSAAPAGGDDPYAAFKTVGGDTAGGGGFFQRAASSGTLGGSDWALAGIEGKPHADVVKENQRYAEQHPWLATGADLLGYGGLSAATGGLGTEAAVARAGLTGIPALMARGAAESALAGGGSTLVNTGDPGQALSAAAGGAALGGAVGGIGGKLVGGAVKAPAMGDALASLEAAKTGAFNDLKAIPADARTVSQAIDGTMQGLGPSERTGLSSNFKDQVQGISDEAAKSGNSLNVSDVNSWQRQLHGAARSPTDRIAATRIGEQLLAISPDEQQAANLAQGRFSDAQWLADTGGRQAATEAPDRLAKEGKGYIFDAPGKQAMQNLAASAPGKLWQTGENAIAPWLNRIAGGVAGGLTGGVIGHSGMGEIAGAMGAHGGGGMGGYLSRLPANMWYMPGRARKALLATLTGNQLVKPSQIAGVTPAWVPQAAQQYIRSKEASSGD
jgi:hypothetical protein